MKTSREIDEQCIDAAIAALSARGSALNLKTIALYLGVNKDWFYRCSSGREELRVYATARLDGSLKSGKRVIPRQSQKGLSSTRQLILDLLSQRGPMSTERIMMALGAESLQARRVALYLLQRMKIDQKIVKDDLYDDAWRLPGKRQLFVKRKQPQVKISRDLRLATWTPADAIRIREIHRASRAAMWGQDEDEALLDGC